ncbi:MAG: repair protein RecO [Patescibacteria group bacterium]|nr:DNA repair protein RecO [Candidatus Saccharibacteria bacterium]MDQ5963764.1 repair protein RecO [Patescibacteria group bacterium]
MNQKKTTAIILNRVDFGEADRILTVLTPYDGKLSLMAKGVRKVRSKLAGGIELFSENELTYIPGRGEMGTLVSSRMTQHYSSILTDIDRTMLGYDLIKLLHKSTEQHAEHGYYDAMRAGLEGLSGTDVPIKVVRLWFWARLLTLDGHAPNLLTEREGAALRADKKYEFDFDSMAMSLRPSGTFGAPEIKFLRLLFSRPSPVPFKGIDTVDELCLVCRPLLSSLKSLYLAGN